MTAGADRNKVKCPKCGGRTVLDDVHTHLGLEVERRCIVCGKRFVQQAAGCQDAPKSASAGEIVTSADHVEDMAKAEEIHQMAKRGKCAGSCGKDDVIIIGAGLCWKCRKAAIEAGTYQSQRTTVKPAAATSSVSPPPPRGARRRTSSRRDDRVSGIHITAGRSNSHVHRIAGTSPIAASVAGGRSAGKARYRARLHRQAGPLPANLHPLRRSCRGHHQVDRGAVCRRAALEAGRNLP